MLGIDKCGALTRAAAKHTPRKRQQEQHEKPNRKRGGAEREFSDGLYTKANGTFSLAFDISGMGYTHFSANVGVDKVIRDNVPWGSYANATVRVYADGELLYERKNIGWKADYSSFAVRLPDGARTLTLEIADTSGQGGVGWGDCLLYR